MNPLKIAASFVAVSLAIALSIPTNAQTPANAPASANGICKDGTYSTAAVKDGACRGHKGVQTWYKSPPSMPAPTPAASVPSLPAPAAATSAPSMPAPRLDASDPTNSLPAPTVSAQQPRPSTPSAVPVSKEAAAGGGPGLVWLNTSSKVYHCPTSEFYGKTKTGAYMTEAEAKAKGAHPNHNKPCS